MLSSLRWSAWGPEYAVVVGATVSFIAMVILLAHFDGESVFVWEGVTLNAIVSILSVIIKAAVAFAIAECMAQWKWILFAREERPLIDFDRIDAATRGPLGSLRILLKTKGGWIVQLGAILTLLAVGLDPLAQQLIQFEETVVFTRGSLSNSNDMLPALNSRAPYYSMGRTMVTERQNTNSTSSNYDVATDIPLSMQGAILNGLSRPVWESEQDALVQCPTSNCTFDQFSTLGICHRCSDISSQLKRVEDFGDVFLAIPGTGYGGKGVQSTAFALPNGHFIANIDGCPPYNGNFASQAYCKGNESVSVYSDKKYAITSFGTGNPNRTVTMKDINTLLWSMSLIYPDVETLNKSTSFTPGDSDGKNGLKLWPDFPMKATECSLYYCVKHVNSAVEGNKLKENVTQAPGFRRDPDSWKRLDEKENGQPENLLPVEEAGTLEFNKYWSVVGYTSLVLESPNNSTEDRYRIAPDSVKSLSAHFQSMFRGNWNNGTEIHEELDKKLGKGAVGFNGASFGPYLHLQGGMEADPPALNGLWTWSRNDITSIFSSLATSMTNEMRRNFDPQFEQQTGQDDRFRDGTLSYQGNVGRLTTLYRIKWPWITLHGIMILSAALFLFLTLISSNREGDVALWKSSSLATIRHGRDVGDVLNPASSTRDMEATARKAFVTVRRGDGEEAKSCIDRSPSLTPAES
ncbi:uncharacterized protein CTRU02_202599 [Colletotrichum truncatum]|uniref:Uncharacterized protein n=1 Tax=Colletotrichum truncatum TaxID=5467 RepID=A0ACC3ZKP6_COLTU|nr:uncharacterized protein CTRU02_01768 [Colletotrichum truncatum]KAF6800089.1 hypothetical protein CTRU02_01768 [Colletotrichum truncatum]